MAEPLACRTLLLQGVQTTGAEKLLLWLSRAVSSRSHWPAEGVHRWLVLALLLWHSKAICSRALGIQRAQWCCHSLLLWHSGMCSSCNLGKVALQWVTCRLLVLPESAVVAQ